MGESKQDVTSNSKTSVDSKYSMDLDDLYKDTHLPERERPVKKAKKNAKKKDTKHSKKKADDVVDMNAESPFVRSYRPSSAPSEEPSGDNHVADKNQSWMSSNHMTDQSDLPQVHRSSNGFVPRERNNNNTNAALSFNPNNVNTDIANLDDDLVPITGSPSNQIFQSNVPKLSAHNWPS